jgi:hypothetical protein
MIFRNLERASISTTPAFWLHTGVICVWLKLDDRHHCNFGTAGETWGGQVNTEDEAYIGYIELGLSVAEPDAAQVASAIHNAITNCRVAHLEKFSAPPNRPIC